MRQLARSVASKWIRRILAREVSLPLFRARNKPKKPAALPLFRARDKPKGGSPDLKEDPLFKLFLRERYGGGSAKVSNPNPKTRGRYPQVGFWTAMKFESWQTQVSSEFEDWKGKRDEQPETKVEPRAEMAPRARIGDSITDAGQVRPGDFLQWGAGPKVEVVEVQGDRVTVRAPGGKPVQVKSIAQGKYRRVSKPKDSGEPSDKPTRAPKQDEILSLAREGKIVEDVPLGGGVNISRIRTLKSGDQEHQFVWKPAYGEQGLLRYGLTAGDYHRREGAVYGIDRLLGEGTVVPPTITNGEGSYQAFVPGAKTIPEAFEQLALLEDQELIDNPSIQRLIILDVLTGHEDRHSNNVMVRWEGAEDDPKNLRVIAIDNGLALADPEEKPEDVGASWSVRDPWPRIQGPKRSQRRDILSGVLRRIPKELHERLRKVDLGEYAKTMLDSGIKSKSILRAALVRLAALQEDPEILASYFDKWQSAHTAIAKFLDNSGRGPRALLKQAMKLGSKATEKLRQIDEIVGQILTG